MAGAACWAQRLVLPGGERTWTVLGRDHRPAGPAEEYLEYLRAQRVSPNTVKSYARALALWREYLEQFGLGWDVVTLEDFGGFLTWLRTGDGREVVSIEPRMSRFAESAIAVRLRAVTSFCGYHLLNGVAIGGGLHRIVRGRGGAYKPLPEHVARRGGRRQAVIRIRQPRAAAPPALTPGQIDRICDACGIWDSGAREWRGSVRNRLLRVLLAGSGLRLGEALGLQHRDWHTGRGDSPFIEVVPREHQHEVRAKSGYRRLFVSDEVDRLYGEYAWQLCEAGAGLATDDFGASYVFVSLGREPRFAPWKPDKCLRSGGPASPAARRAGPGRLDSTLVPPLSRDRPAAVGRPGACGEPAARPRWRAGHAQHICARHRGRRASGRGGLGEADRRVAGRGGQHADRIVLMGSKQLPEAMRDGSGCYAPGVLDTLWPALPGRFRTVELVSAGLGSEDLAAFSPGRGVRGFRVKFRLLPDPVDRELAWCCWRIPEPGGRVPVAALQSLVRWLAATAEDQVVFRGSLMGHTPRERERALAFTCARRHGELPGKNWLLNITALLRRCCQMLWSACGQRPWWRREVRDPGLDPRIPRRAHEPMGGHSVCFRQLQPLWLRPGLQWYLKVSPEAGDLTWSTVRSRRSGLQVFGDWLAGQQSTPPPWLRDDPAGVRVFMLEFLSHVRSQIARAGPGKGKSLSTLRVNGIVTDVGKFCAFMTGHRETAARALDEPAWLRPGPCHAILWRHGEKGRPAVRPERREVTDDTAFSQIVASLHLPGTPAGDGGAGDGQVMRIMMLVARTGRRISEIRMLDRNPLFPVGRLTRPGENDAGDGAFAARLRYQQAKIEQAPDTMLIGAGLVAIIRGQQQWAGTHLAPRWAPGVVPEYLFPAHKMNRHAGRAFTVGRIRQALAGFARRLDIKDSAGRLVDFNRTRRFRHTKATSLLNAGVPLHVVQRYTGHLTPAMTMEYAETLAGTHEAGFLRYRKVTAGARELEVDARDLYDMLELDKRTDRILPSGWCLLPPRQVCGKGNACLTCEKFTTGATFLPELKVQQSRTGQLIEERCQAFKTRTGQAMSAGNVWLAGRLREQDALGRIIVKLGQTRLVDGSTQAVRGAGVSARTDAIAVGQSGSRGDAR